MRHANLNNPKQKLHHRLQNKKAYLFNTHSSIPSALSVPSIMKCIQKLFGQGLLFWQIISSNIAQAIRHRGLSTSFHHHMVFLWWETAWKKPWFGNSKHHPQGFDMKKVHTHWVPQDLMQQHRQRWTVINCWPSTIKTSQISSKD